MECKTTSRDRRRAAFSFVEVMVAMSLGLVLVATLLAMSSFMGRSFTAFSNYSDLDRKSRLALDTLSKDIRRADALLTNTATRLTFRNPSGTVFRYDYDATARALTKTVGTVTNVLLTECDYMNFGVYQRNTISNTYEQFTNATPATCKVVQFEWICSREILGSKLNTESVQSAKIVIRRK